MCLYPSLTSRSRPACTRCTSTGRVCDGFGIWGGGSAQARHVRSGLTDIPSSPPMNLDILCLSNVAEREAFDWYLSYTTWKLPGLFASSFWSTLVLQACHTDAAVLSAVLALGCAHRARPTLPSKPQKLCNGLPDEDERAFLQHYTTAIQHLRQDHSSKRNKKSLHVSLITCVLFACMELICGHYRTGESLLRQGVKLLQDRNAQLKQSRCDGEAEDDWIREALERLCIPAIQLGGPSLWKTDEGKDISVELKGMPTRIESLHDARYAVSPPPIFESILQARETLDRLLHATLDVAKQCQDPQLAHQNPGLHHEMLVTQRNLRTKLESWNMAFIASRVHMAAQHGAVGTVAYQMLDRYYNMTSIMLATCTQPSNQMAYDVYRAEFLAIIRTSIALYDSILVRNVLTGTAHSHRQNLARFVADRGWIMPLYYTATKCRVHGIRMQAINLLEKSYTREGVWDSTLAAAVAREIVRMEEGNFYADWDLNDGSAFDSIPDEQQLTLPVLPEWRRVSESRVELPDDPWGKTFVHCQRGLHDGSGEEVLTREYDPAT